MVVVSSPPQNHLNLASRQHHRWLSPQEEIHAFAGGKQAVLSGVQASGLRSHFLELYKLRAHGIASLQA